MSCRCCIRHYPAWCGLPPRGGLSPLQACCSRSSYRLYKELCNIFNYFHIPYERLSIVSESDMTPGDKIYFTRMSNLISTFRHFVNKRFISLPDPLFHYGWHNYTPPAIPEDTVIDRHSHFLSNFRISSVYPAYFILRDIAYSYILHIVKSILK